MADVGDNNFVRYIYRGEEDEHIPLHATHVTVYEFTTVVRTGAFRGHQNIVEVICHDKVEKIEREAFWCCRSLRRVIMPGVKIAEARAFYYCDALTDVECDKLERIGEEAFGICKALRSIHLPSAEVVEEAAFEWCEDLTDVKFGNKLERIEERAFISCESLERITIPLKHGLITDDDVFQGCDVFERIDLIEGEMHETVAALHLEEWKNDMNEEIDSINQILPDTDAGWDNAYGGDSGEKAAAIRRWIRAVFGKIVDYQEEHQRVLNEAATTLQQLALPRDIVMNNVIPFLALPPHTFEEEDEDEVEDVPEEEYSEGEESEDNEDELEEEVSEGEEPEDNEDEVEDDPEEEYSKGEESEDNEYELEEEYSEREESKDDENGNGNELEGI
eukprot:CAMPEP_0201709846 /NCGR_PEP_ID=MMETSP0578-20130828/58318_1 /ASSEMBLY_ACC=CAM_ASM_000663 /TAXON_ID=267565 /ORGANISM="Skeletonema grethea, Strain CCMP 1804" /LENGTH=389 /DNA_ID=CAMNT_0048198841 /DNA_START=148 /DNA_END=1317 /DNA_ORIENTATION=-